VDYLAENFENLKETDLLLDLFRVFNSQMLDFNQSAFWVDLVMSFKFLFVKLESVH